MPGGKLSQMFGGKLLFGVGVLMNAVGTILTPLAAKLHVAAFIFMRILEGLGGVSYTQFVRIWLKNVRA